MSQLWLSFAVRRPNESDNIPATVSAIEMLTLLQAPHLKMSLHSSRCDSRIAWPKGRASTFGFVLVQARVVKSLLALKLVHCLGPTFRPGETGRISNCARRGTGTAWQHTVRQHDDRSPQASGEVRRASELCARDGTLPAPTQQRGSGDAGIAHAGAVRSPRRGPGRCAHAGACASARDGRRPASRLPYPRSGWPTEPRRQYCRPGRVTARIASTRLGAAGALVRRHGAWPPSTPAQDCPDARSSTPSSTRSWRKFTERSRRVSAPQRDSSTRPPALPKHPGEAL
jgi:hypothetical protein